MGMSGGQQQSSGPQSVTQTNITEPWAPQKPYLTQGFQAAQDLFLDSHPNVFPNSMTLPFSPETQTALQLTTQRALNGSPLTQNANAQLLGTMQGAYLDNPTTRGNYLYGGAGFNAAVDAATNKILPQVDSNFEGAGRYNSGLARVAQTQAISDAFANQYGQERQLQEQNFNNQRQQQLQATMLAPQFASQDYNDYAMLANVGQTYQDQLQNQLNEQIYRYGYDANMNRDDLITYMNLINGNFGGTSTGTSTTSGSTTTTSGGKNPILGALGGALSGSSLFGAGGSLASLGLGGGWGAAIGGGLGLLSGIL